VGLFDIFKTKQKDIELDNKESKFTTQIVKTDNVSKSLSEIAKKYNLALSSIDFNILNVETYIRLHKDDDFVLMDDETENLIIKEKLLLNEDFEIKQSYEIRVQKFIFLDDFELIGKFQANKSLTRATFVVSPNSLLNYSRKLESQILDELYKKKLKSQMIIQFKPFEEKLLDDIKNLITKIRVVGMIEDDFSVTLCEAITPIEPVKMEIIEHYKVLAKEDEFVKELIYPIKKDDVIIEIIKPQEGKNGRNCRGEYIKVSELKESKVPEFKINGNEAIKKEDTESIKYISNKNGYVYLKGNVIFVKDELEVNQISLKTGNVKGAEDSDVKLEVNESDVMKEAIRDGMVVETTELLVKGNIGNNTRIKAKKLVIEGQTHRNSKIVAIDVDINIHRGLLKGKEVLIHRLEGGRVEAEKVHILQAIGGEVIAKEIKIDLLGSHITLISSDLIEIQTLKGSENKFIIDESQVEHKTEYIQKQEKTIKELEIKFRQYKEKYDINKQIILRNKFSINELKEKINKYKQNNLPIKPVWLQKLKKYNDFVKQTKKIEDSLKEIKEKIESIKNELDKMQNSIFLAKVISHSGFSEFNRIEFHLIEPFLTITYDTKETDRDIEVFMLKDFGEMDYKIVGSKDDSSS
jgi:hypothetical protein